MKRGTLSHGSGLRRLKMREGKRGLRLILVRKVRQFTHHIHQLLFYQLKRLRHHNNIRVVPHIAGGRTQMDNALRLWALHAVRIYMAHHIMAHDGDAGVFFGAF